MSKADYPYADDEFDAPTGPDVPRGVHRAPRSAWSRWWPFVVVIIVVPAIAYALVTWASRDNSTSDDATSPAASTSASSTPKASETPSASDEPSEEPSDEASPSDEPTASEEPTAAVELDTPVTVYNAAGIEGLAASPVDELEGAGFTTAQADNFSGTKPGTSTIYYASEDLEPTAALVGQTIGVDALELSASDAGDGIAVVLISDPTP